MHNANVRNDLKAHARVFFWLFWPTKGPKTPPFFYDISADTFQCPRKVNYLYIASYLDFMGYTDKYK